MKRRFSTELAYVLGIVSIAWGVVLMEKADFGVSMIVAPAYLLYRWLSPAWGFFTFGMAEYCLQAVLLIVMTALIRKFRFFLPVCLRYGGDLWGCTGRFHAFRYIASGCSSVAEDSMLLIGNDILCGRSLSYVSHLYFA